jgi:F-type H+-transporting ATPase subunit b
MTILPDVSLFIQLITFLVLLLILNLILYRPVRKIIKERKNVMDGFVRTREDFETRAIQSDQKLQEQNTLAKQKGNQVKTALVQEALASQENLLQQATSTTHQKLEKDRTEIHFQETEARKALERELDLFSKALAERILGRSIQ